MSTLQQEFESFHRANPAVYEGLVRLAREWRASGKLKCGIKMLWERLRWELGVRVQGDEAPKLNNNYHSRYARLIADNHPDLASMFDLRQLKDGWGERSA